MKSKSNFLLTGCMMMACLLSTSQYLLSQQDPGWYILTSKGRTSADPVTGNIAYSNPINGNFTIEGEPHPNRLCHPWAKNDVFIIYDDVAFYNSRESPVSGPIPYPVDFFYPGTAGNALQEITHGFIPPAGKNVAYMYMTSKYEDNDPPPPAKASAGINNGVRPYYPSVTDLKEFIDANHDVVNGRDITLIIHLEALRPYVNEGEERKKQIILTTNRIHRIGTSDTLVLANAFNTSDVFNAAGWFPQEAFTRINDNAYAIDPFKSKYGFLNLRNKPDLNFGFPSANNGVVAYEMVFDLYGLSSQNQLSQLGNVTPLQTHSEALQSSHDPNVVRVEGTCEMNGGQYVLYHIEFQNNAVVSADSLKIELDFPAYFDESCVTASAWQAGTNTDAGSIDRVDGKVLLIFPPAASVIMCPAEDDEVSCRGMVDIRIAVNAGTQLRHPSFSLQPECHVFFGKDKYPLHRFEDPLDIETREVSKDKSGGAVIEMLRPASLTQCGSPCMLPCSGIACWPWWQWVLSILAAVVVILFLRRLMRKP